jgi:hypothetical protein
MWAIARIGGSGVIIVHAILGALRVDSRLQGNRIKNLVLIKR